jgi:acyl-ACP thioesterase
MLCLSWLGDLRVLIKKIIAQLPLGLQKLNKVLLIERRPIWTIYKLEIKIYR